MIVEGRVWILDDDDINTDVIFPGKYTYEPLTPEEMAQHALEDFDPSFASNVKKGDVIIAGRNFGCGSSREQAVTALKYAGISAIIAESFARIYYRNAINQAFLVVESPLASRYARENRERLAKSICRIDASKGVIKLGGEEFSFSPLKGKALEIFNAGGLVEYTKKRISSA